MALVSTRADRGGTAAVATPQPQLTDYNASPAALTVLTDPTLWRTITSLMSGWPFAVFRFYQQHISSYKLHCSSKVWNNAMNFSQTRGTVPHIAIAENDLKMLQLIYELRKNPCYQVYGKLSFHNVMACTVHYKRMEVLAWMADMAKKESNYWIWEHELMMHALTDDHENYQLLDLLRDRFP